MWLLYRAIVVSPFYLVDADWAMIRMITLVELGSVKMFFLVAYEAVVSGQPARRALPLVTASR
jgi:hypothetical protein